MLSTTRWLAWADLKAPARQTALAGGSLALCGLIAQLADTQRLVEGWSLGTAYCAFILLAASMALGPLNVLRKKHNPVHSAVRRDVGIAAGIAGLVHTALGLQVHMGGALARYFVVPTPATASGLAFVAANYLGLMSAAVLAGLVAISNNPGVRSLGLERWKKFQRLAYVAAIAAVAHGVIYQLLEKRNAALIFFVAAGTAFVMMLQLRGTRVRRESSAVTESSSARVDQQ